MREHFRCYDPGTLAIAALAIGAGTSVAGGFMGKSAADSEAKMQEEQGRVALDESKKSAEIEAYNQNQAVGRQRLAYLANGVTLEGSPSAVLADSEKHGQESVDAILRQGNAQYNLAKKSAQITRNKGRAALIGSIGSAVGSTASAYPGLKQAGAFDK